MTRTEALIEYVGADASQTAFVESCVDAAVALVSQFVGSSDVPAGVLERAILEVGSEMFHRRNAPNGVAQFAVDGSAIRVARDPMVGAYPLLARYVGGGFA